MNNRPYQKKIKLWLEHPVLYRPPKAKGWIPFGSRKFSSYEEFNQWKRDYLARLASSGGLSWTK